MQTIDAAHDLLSANKLCELLQATPGEVERAAARAGVVAALRLDGRAWYTDAAVTAIRRALNAKAAK